MKKQRIIRPRILNQPMHRAQYIRLGRLTHRVLLIVCQNDHILTLVPEVLVQVGRHVLDVVDAAAQLALLVEVVDADEQGLATAGAERVLEGVVAGRAVAEGLRLLRRRRWAVVGAVLLGVCWCALAPAARRGVEMRTRSLSVELLLGRRVPVGLLLGRGRLSAGLASPFQRERGAPLTC
jgi:hypothetical protein